MTSVTDPAARASSIEGRARPSTVFGAIALSIAIISSGCPGLIVNSRLATQAGVTVSCRLSPGPGQSNRFRLRVLVIPACTTQALDVTVLRGEQIVGPTRHYERAIYPQSDDAGRDRDRELDTSDFQVAPGTWVTTQVEVTCARGGKQTAGADTCQVQ